MHILFLKSLSKLRKPTHRWNIILLIGFTVGICCETLDSLHISEDAGQWLAAVVHRKQHLGSMFSGELLTSLANINLLIMELMSPCSERRNL